MSFLIYVDSLITKVPEKYTSKLSEFKEYYSSKLWHQLAVLLLELMSNEDFYSPLDMKEFYKSMLCEIDYRIENVVFCRILAVVCKVISQSEPDLAIEYINKSQKLLTTNQFAMLLTKILLAEIYLIQQKFVDVRNLLEEVEQAMLEIDGVTIVHQRYYETSCAYLKTQGDYSGFYRDALKYFGCVDFNCLPENDKKVWANSIALSAMLGEDVYNFGELMLSGFLKELQGTKEAYIKDMIVAFSRGNLKQFDNLAQNWKSNPDLAQKEIFLRQKLTLLCLMELIFHRPPNRRSFTFEEISVATQVPIEEVELLLIFALSKQLVNGKIDEVENRVTFNWLKPKVLDKNQISSMKALFQDLACKSGDTAREANELLKSSNSIVN